MRNPSAMRMEQGQSTRKDWKIEIGKWKSAGVLGGWGSETRSRGSVTSGTICGGRREWYRLRSPPEKVWDSAPRTKRVNKTDEDSQNDVGDVRGVGRSVRGDRQREWRAAARAGSVRHAVG